MLHSQSAKRDFLRQRILHVAARLMAEDGISDYALAKRKAARQLGVADSQHLPSDEEVRAALSEYRTLFQDGEHVEVVRQLRSEALAMMRRLADFRPYLTGSVLDGSAGRHSDINLVLFSDDAKAVLLFLLRHKLAFEDGEWRVRLGGREASVPSYTLTTESGARLHIVVLPENAQRSGGRHPETHADIAAVEALLGKR